MNKSLIEKFQHQIINYVDAVKKFIPKKNNWRAYLFRQDCIYGLLTIIFFFYW